mgnify:FL=1
MKVINRPQCVDKLTCYYENFNSITVVREILFRGKYLKTEHFDIPLGKLKKSIKRIETK